MNLSINNPTDTNQSSDDEPINQHLVCLWQLQDIEETIADASPEELVGLYSKLMALSTDITEAVQSAIRTEKLKLLAEVRERVVGEDEDRNHRYNENWKVEVDAQNYLRKEQRATLAKLEAEL